MESQLQNFPQGETEAIWWTGSKETARASGMGNPPRDLMAGSIPGRLSGKVREGGKANIRACKEGHHRGDVGWSRTVWGDHRTHGTDFRLSGAFIPLAPPPRQLRVACRGL